MHIICLTPLEDGVYNDHASDNITAPPEGWAYIPDDFPLPATFPRLGSLEAEEISYPYGVEVEKVNEETGETEIVIEERTVPMMTVTKMTEGTLPEPEPAPEPEPTADDVLNTLLGVE
jgi:hypothetical protein